LTFGKSRFRQPHECGRRAAEIGKNKCGSRMASGTSLISEAGAATPYEAARLRQHLGKSSNLGGRRTETPEIAQPHHLFNKVQLLGLHLITAVFRTNKSTYIITHSFKFLIQLFIAKKRVTPLKLDDVFCQHLWP
jgi:hypothetical protein